MDKQSGKAQVRQSGAINPGDYERGLNVLARLIARVHIQRAAKTLGNRDDLSKDKK